MKKIITLFILLISKQFYSQKTKIQILNLKDNIPIENVQIYSDSTLIDKTNQDGYFYINLNKINKISLVKENYYDTIINKKDINKNIYLSKINALVLKEVIVTNLNVEHILDSIYNNNIKLKNILITQNLHFFNSFITGKDTLTYINKRLVHKNREGYFCENDINIVNNFKLKEGGNAIYCLDNKEICFNYDYLHSSPPSNSIEYQILIRYRKFFDYSISKTDGFYKINFMRKKSNKEYPYYGYIIVDAADFGLYEFSCKSTIDKKNKRNLVFKNKIINFKIIHEESFIKYNKNENGKYELVNYSFDSQLEVLDGSFKNSIFINKCRKEPTLPFDASKMKKIDLLTYKLIK
jgi:hypothetical protein